MNAIEWSDREQYVKKLSHKDKVRFALYCAKQVRHLADTPEAKKCIELIELWLDGKATAKECKAAANATNAAYAADAAAYAYDAYAYAAYAAYANAYAAGAAHAANAAAYAAARAADHAASADIKLMLMEYLYELVYKNEIVEQILLIG